MPNNKISLGSDHAGFKLKESIKNYLKEKGYEVKDFGTNSEESVDYPDYAKAVAKDVIKNNSRGILICGTGIGMSIAANKIKGIRAALCRSEYDAEMSRRHNDANILTLGSRTTHTDDAKKIVDVFLNTPFEEGRHIQRIKKIHDMEK
jgi:ribose 5-phosphate isomerase B